MGYVKAFLWLAVFSASIITALMLPETPVDFINLTGASDQVILVAKMALMLTGAGSIVAAISNVAGGMGQ